LKKLFAAIFGSKDHTETVLDAGVKGLDALFYTAEEKAENAARFGDLYLRYLAATNPQNLARRLIALVVVGLWAFLILVGVALWKLDAGYSAFVFSTLDNIVNLPFTIVVGFYFAAHVARLVGEKQ
jgi:hypothetical protein